MSQYTMQYGGGAGTGRAGSLLTPLLPRIAVGAYRSRRHQIFNCEGVSYHEEELIAVLSGMALESKPCCVRCVRLIRVVGSTV